MGEVLGGAEGHAAVRNVPGVALTIHPRSAACGVGVKPLVWQPTYDGAGNLHRVTIAYCPVFEMNLYAERPEDQPRIEAKRAARILAGLEPAPTDAEQALEAALLEALQWCSGSDDFQKGGKAREGWLRVCAPLLIWEART